MLLASTTDVFSQVEQRGGQGHMDRFHLQGNKLSESDNGLGAVFQVVLKPCSRGEMASWSSYGYCTKTTETPGVFRYIGGTEAWLHIVTSLVWGVLCPMEPVLRQARILGFATEKILGRTCVPHCHSLLGEIAKQNVNSWERKCGKPCACDAVASRWRPPSVIYTGRLKNSFL